MKILIIDNYDSFVYTIEYYFKCLGVETDVVKNDDPFLMNISDDYTHLVLSPGPGHPSNAGYLCDVILKYYKKYPMLGVCLGHQAIIHAFGGKVIHAPKVMHGKMSKIFHNGIGLFNNLPQGFSVVRYHSLCADETSIPDEILITAKTDDNVIMGIQHKHFPLFGIQYHPEAALSEYGEEIFSNFLK